ncbi:NUDIX hydrolase [Aminipila terrae]|uniref:NUDIX domain-containing protein n=1 Tax=Aminipila terrae TaxID=2697030 RepID=A0A6P1M9E2_9FIRM|nr:CoA pyrophosphatase [Aminipila terrae]QHI71230.1 NUDIX domain-containing protein [Aminipila terrae]
MNEIEEIFKNRKPAAVGYYNYFSVMVPLVEKDGELHLLYEVRAESLRTQPGEICFPGGAVEKNETKRQCAIRETREELGVLRKDIRVIAELDTLYTYSNFTMYSFLGEINYEAIKNAKINRDEVKEFFLVPLEHMKNQAPYIYNMDVLPQIGTDFPYNLLKLNNGYNWRKGKSEVPIYTYEDKVIWGLTARITHNLVNIIKLGSRD